MRWLLALICLSFATLSPASTVQTLDGKTVEKVLVLKSAHQLQLINDGKPFKTYRISLGKNPKGHKLIEGDRRTPEGQVVTADELARATAANLHEEFATVVTTDDVVG